jgi:hypothetical protein
VHPPNQKVHNEVLIYSDESPVPPRVPNPSRVSEA